MAFASRFDDERNVKGVTLDPVNNVVDMKHCDL